MEMMENHFQGLIGREILVEEGKLEAKEKCKRAKLISILGHQLYKYDEIGRAHV